MNICVFCASAPQTSEAFKAEARLIGNFIAEQGHTLVYGGATGGLMDAVAEAVHEGGGDIIGVVPQVIVDKGRKSTLPDQLYIVGDMSERKEMMKEFSDVFIVLPGGFGTFDEMCDAIASGMIGFHDGKVIVINSDDYYAGLIALIDRMHHENLGYNLKDGILKIVNSAEECINYLQTIQQ